MEELQSVAERKHAEIEALKTTESKHLEMLHKLEESCRALECERLRERTELCSRLHDSEVSSIMKFVQIDRCSMFFFCTILINMTLEIH